MRRLLLALIIGLALAGIAYAQAMNNFHQGYSGSSSGAGATVSVSAPITGDGSVGNPLGLDSTVMTSTQPNVAATSVTVTSTPTADWSTKVRITHILTTATNATETFTTPTVATGQSTCRTLFVCQPAAGTLDSLTWPTSCNSSDVAGCITWGAAGAAPALTQVLGEGDLFQFCYDQITGKYAGMQVATALKPCPL